MGKTRDWPTDLRKKINFRKSQVRDDFVAEYIIECNCRIRLLFDFFGVDQKLPGSWEYLIVRLCNHWDIPGFQSSNAQGRGAPRRWTDIKNCELFADVMALASGMSEHAACVHICNASKYSQRYSKYNSKTIHRQFLRAKNRIKTDPIFRLQYIGGGGLGPTDYGPELIKVAIRRYGLRNKSKP